MRAPSLSRRSARPASLASVLCFGKNSVVALLRLAGVSAKLPFGENTVVQKDTLHLGWRADSFRLRFNPQVQSFEIFHDATGSADGYHWTRLAEPGLGPTSLDDGGNDLGAAQRGGAVSLYGFGDRMKVPVGQMALDNFILSSNGPSFIRVWAALPSRFAPWRVESLRSLIRGAA